MSLLLAMALAKELEVDGWAEEGARDPGEFLCHGEARHSFFLFLCKSLLCCLLTPSLLFALLPSWRHQCP